MDTMIIKGSLTHSIGQLGETNGQKSRSQIGTQKACEDRHLK